MRNPEKPGYKIVDPATWELIRAAYLAGESAPALAERYHVSVHAIRRRAAHERWTKRAYAQAQEARAPRNAAAEAERQAAIDEWIEKVAAEEEAFDIANALERRALAQAGAAMAQGRSKDAQALASLAEQMRKRAEGVRASASPAPAGVRIAEAPHRGIDENERGDFVADMFAKIACIAAAMLHAPTTAPAAFLDLIAQWRVLNLGEGEADAEARAAVIAKAQAAYLNGDWLATMPEEIRARMQAGWAQRITEAEAQI